VRNLSVHLLVLSLLLCLPSAVSAAGPSDDWKWIFQHGEKKWLPQLEVTGRPGNHDLYGLDVDPLIPIAQNNDSMYYLNVRGSLFWDDGDFTNEVNVGGGYRRLMGNDSWILGGYGFYDRMETVYDNVFNQGTLGVEAMAWDWDARINGYIAEFDDKSATAAGGSRVSLRGTSISMETMREQALSGFDAEIGYRLPFFGDDGVLSDMRFYVGGFYLTNDLVHDIGGPAARFEMRIWEVPFLPEESRVTLGANYRWDDVRNHQVQGILGLRIPLGRPNRAQPLTHLERRMTDRVVRDISIVTNTGLGGREAVVTRTGAPIDNAYFFDAETDGTGSFSDPMTLENAADTGENNLLIGLARTGDIDVGFGDGDLQNGQTVMGGGTELYVRGAESGEAGVYRAPGQPATLCCTGTALTLAENNTIAGLTFRSMGRALELELDYQTTMLDVYNNHFSGMEHAIEIDVVDESGLQAYIRDNYFENQGSAVDVWAPVTFQLAFDVTGNQFSNLGTGLDFDLNPDGSFGNPSGFALNAVNNDFLDVESGIVTDVYFSGNEDYTHTSSIMNNRFWSVEYDDYELTLEGAAPSGDVALNVEVANNESLNGDTFVDIELDPIQYGQATFNVHDNRSVGTAEGISIDVDEGPDVDVTIHRNEIIGAWDGDAVNVRIDDSGDIEGHNITVTENWIENTYDDDGIDISVQDSYATTLIVADNTVRDTGSSGSDNGIEIDFDNVEYDGNGNSITVTGNTVEFVNGGNNIEVEVRDSYAETSVTIEDNTLAYNDNSHGIEFDFVNNGYGADGSMISISDNAIHDIDESGIDVWLNDLDYGDTIAINDNGIRRTADGGGNGIEINTNNVEYVDVELRGNTIEDADDGDNGNGIQLELGDFYRGSVTIEENDISRSGEHGIEIDLEDGTHDNTVAINDNNIVLSDENGIDIYVPDGNADNTLSIGGNEISYVEDGIQIDSDDGSTTLDSDSNNTVTDFSDDAADIDGTGTGEIEVNGSPYGFP